MIRKVVDSRPWRSSDAILGVKEFLIAREVQVSCRMSGVNDREDHKTARKRATCVHVIQDT